MAPQKHAKAEKDAAAGVGGGAHARHFINVGLPFQAQCCPFDEVNCMARLLAARVFRNHQKLFALLERYEVRLLFNHAFFVLIEGRWRFYGAPVASPRIPQNRG